MSRYHRRCGDVPDEESPPSHSTSRGQLRLGEYRPEEKRIGEPSVETQTQLLRYFTHSDRNAAGIQATLIRHSPGKPYAGYAAAMRYLLASPQCINMRLRNTRDSFATARNMTVATCKGP